MIPKELILPASEWDSISGHSLVGLVAFILYVRVCAHLYFHRFKCQNLSHGAMETFMSQGLLMCFFSLLIQCSLSGHHFGAGGLLSCAWAGVCVGVKGGLCASLLEVSDN